MRAGARAPGGAPSPILPAPRGGTAPADAAEPSRFVALGCPSCAFVDHFFSVCFRQAPPPPCREDHTRVKHPIVNKGEPRMHTNRHEYRWTCLAAMTSRDEGRERGRPARTTLAQPHPSPPPGSTGNGARRLLRPTPGRCRRQGGVCRITGKRSGHPTQRMRARCPRSRRGAFSHPSCSARRHCPCRCGRAVPLRGPWSFFVCLRGSLFFRLFQTSTTPALPGRSSESETREVHSLSGTRFLNMDAQDAQDSQDGRVQQQS